MGLRSLDQRDVRNLTRYFAEPPEQASAIGQVQSLGIVVRSGHHPGQVAERKILSRHALDAGARQAGVVLERLDDDVRQHLCAAFQPEPEKFIYTRQQAGIDYVMRAANKHGSTPHDPYFADHEGALLRFTPTLTIRALRTLERALATAAYEASMAGGADPFEVAIVVNEVVPEWMWSTVNASNRREVHQHVVGIIERSIAQARDTKDVAAKEHAREVLATAKREAAALYDAATNAYATAREALFPPKRRPRSAPPVQMANAPAAYELDAAE